MILEGWATKINDVADHTHVYCPGNGRYFDCWGGHSGPEPRRICRGDGSYNWANCYRCPVFSFPDTACIGIYAVDGVCHQSANCFLYSAGVTLNFAVRGYWFSLFSYGTYGRGFLRWLPLYAYCSSTRPRMMEEPEMEPSEAGAGGTGDAGEEDPVIEIVREVHASAVAQRAPRHPHEVLADEVAKVTKHHVPEIDPDQFRDIQLRYLRQKDRLIASGMKEEQLAKRLNDLARRTQEEIARRVGRERYERLMAIPADEQVDLVEPDAAGAAGVPVPPHEEVREEAPGEPEEGETSET